MTQAWRLPMAVTPKMVLLAMCDWANDAGGSLWPSIAQVAERASVSERTAQRVIHSLIEEGWLAVVANVNGGAPGASRHYRINVRKIAAAVAEREAAQAAAAAAQAAADEQAGHVVFAEPKKPAVSGGVDAASETGDKLTRVTSTTETGDTGVTPRVTSTTETGDTGVTLSVNKPSIEPSINRQRADAAARGDDETPKSVAEWAEVFTAEHGVQVDPTNARDRSRFWPLAKDWIQAGVTVGMVRQAVARARAEATEVIAYLPAYVDRVLASMGSRAARAAVRPGTAAKSFAQQEREAGWERWEQMTGRVHPDRAAAATPAAKRADVIELRPDADGVMTTGGEWQLIGGAA